MALTNPTVQRGIVYTNTDTTLEKRDISEVIDLLDPFEVPMLDMVGRDSLKNPCTQIKHEWITDRLLPRAGTLSAAYVAGSGTLALNTGEGKFIIPDDLLLVDDLVFRVNSGPPDSDIMTVTLISGTDTAVTSGSDWRKIANAAQEGGSAREDNRKTVADVPYNYTQILKATTIVSGTMKVIPRYGYVSERAYNEEKELKDLTMSLEQSLIYGVRSYAGGPPRRSTMGGLYEYVFKAGVAGSWDNVVDLADADLTETSLNNVIEDMWQLGAKPDFLMVNSSNKRRITSWGRPYIRTTTDERKFGASIGVYETDFGLLDIVMNRNLRPSDVIIGTQGQLGIGPLNGRQFSSRLLPSTLDGEWWEILGEYTMEVHRPNIDFAWIYNTSKTF